MAKRAQGGGVIEGVGVALLTIFDEEGKLQLSATSELASFLIDAGVRSVLVGGTIGEYYALTDSEKVDLFGAVRSVVPSNVPLILHVGGVPLSRALNLARAAIESGADAIIALPRGAGDLAKYYGEIVSVAGSTPVLAYHFPQVGAAIEVDELADLGVAGVKDSSGDADRLALEVESLEIEVYTGATGLLNLAHSVGAQGALLGLANVHPEMCILAFDGDVESQRSLEAIGQEIATDFPGGLKRFVGERWHVSTATRTPPGLRVSEAGAPNLA